jgi:hypothetical protein
VEGMWGCMSESCHVLYTVLEGIGGCSGEYMGCMSESCHVLYTLLEGIGGCSGGIGWYSGGYGRVHVRELPCTVYSMRN